MVVDVPNAPTVNTPVELFHPVILAGATLFAELWISTHGPAAEVAVTPAR